MPFRIFRRSMHYFEVVARTQSIRAAAEILHIAPSAVSRAVQQLEAEAQVALFDRTARGLNLTVAGEAVLASMQRWKRDTQQLADDVRSLKGIRLESVRVAAVENVACELLPQAIASVRQRVPGLSLALLVGSTQAVLDSMLNGSADIGIVITTPQKVPVRSLCTMKDPVGLVMLPDHPLAARESVKLDECLDEPLVMPVEPLAVRLALRAALDAARPFRAVATSNRIVAIKALVRARLGPSLLTRLDVAPEVNEGLFRFVPLQDESIQHPYISVMAPKGTRRSPTTDLVIETLRKAMPSTEFHS
jgi:DNA-binding transcriptional LysR family regulator